MTERSDIERLLQDWLIEDGPQDVPDRVVAAAIDVAMRTRRKSRLPRPVLAILAGLQDSSTWTPFPSRTVWLATVIFAALLALGVVLAGAFLFHVDRLRTNGPVAFDAGGDIYTFDRVHDDLPVQLTRTLDVQERGPIYSPDGRYLAYWTTEVASSELHVRDFMTGLTIVLGDEDGLVLPLGAGPFGWSPDSTRLVAPARTASSDGMEVGIESVIIFDVTTREVESIPADEPVWSFGWSPDGHIIGLVSQTGLAIYDVEAGVVRPIRGLDGQDTTTPYWLLASPPVFTADSSAILYTDGASATTGGDIWLVSMAQPESQPLLLGGANDVAPVAARDGHRFVYGRSSAATIERAFTEKGGVMRDGSERASDLFLVEGPTASPTAVAWDVWPRASWSPDGRWLVTKSFDRELVFIDLERPERPLRVPLLEHVGGFSWGPQPP